MKKTLIGLAVLSLFITGGAAHASSTSTTFYDLPVNEQVQVLKKRIRKVKQNITNYIHFEEENYSTSIGFESGENIRLMSTAVGHQVMQYATGGGTHVGLRSGRYSTSYGNTGIGRMTMQDEGFSGDQNVAVGEGAMMHATTADNNAMVGNGSGMRLESGSRNVGLGLGTLSSGVSALGNAAIGEDALHATSPDITGTSAFGWGSGRGASANYSLFLGRDAGVDVARDNTLVIANNRDEHLIYGEFDTGYVQVNGDLEADRVIIGEATLFVEGGELKVDIGGVVLTVVTSE